MKRKLSRRKISRSYKPVLESLEQRLALDATAWSSFAGNAQHTSVSTVESQPLEAVHWSTPVDNFPTSRAAHYGGPLVTLNNTVIYPYKTGNTQSTNTPNYHLVARNGNDGSLLWDVTTPFIPASYSWYPQYQPVLATATDRVYFAGKGGTIYYRDNPDSANGTVTQIAFFGSMAHYTANQAAYDNNVFIETPLTADAQGNIFFGFRVNGATPTGLQSGIARISANGTVDVAAGIWVSAFNAAGGTDANITTVQQNGAPALSNDGQTLYVVVKEAGDWVYRGRLVGLNTTTLATQYNSGTLKDPRGSNAAILNLSTSSPMIAPDGKVFLGVFGNPYNGSRGWMLQFSADLQTKYTPGGFGWDTTPSIVPASMLGSQYTGTSSYLIFTKYNNYYFSGGGNDGGDGSNGIAILDPNDTEVEYHHPEQNILVMKRALYKVGPTPDWDYPTVPTAVREWCINYGAVDPATQSVIVNSSDGKFYRWYLPTNSLIEPLTLTSGIGQPYTMTVIGVDGSMYGIQMGQLFALGKTPGVTISDTSIAEGNGGTTNITFTVSLDYPRTAPITVNWATADGTAIAGEDYTSASGTLTFNPGVKTQTISVAINPDLLNENDEAFVVNLTSPSNAEIDDAQGQATLLNDDAIPSLAISDVVANEGNTGDSPYTTFSFTVALSAASGKTVSVQWTTADGAATSADYVAGSGALTFLPGETSKTIVVQVLGDSTHEPNESFSVNLASGVNATIADSQAIGTITNDDGVPSISINDRAVTEGSNATFTVTLSNASSQTITVNFATADGTATANDYVATSGTLTFAPGILTRTFIVSTINDSLDEFAETYFVNLTNPTNGFLSDSQGQGTINDNDPAPTLSIDDVSLTEGLSGTKAFTFTVLLSAVSGRTVTVNYATANGTATTANSDYQSKTGSLTFAQGETSKSVTVLVNGDSVNELDETFLLKLSGASGATFTKSQGVGTILNDDSTALSVSDVSHSEGNSGTTSYAFTVNLSSPSSEEVTVQVSTADDSATLAGGDFQALAMQLTFAPGEVSKTVTVLVNGDDLNEVDEFFFLQLSSPVGATINDGLGLGTILNDDPEPSISVGDLSEPEMDYNTGTFTVYVTLSAPSGREISVSYRTENGTATSTSNVKDYIDTLGVLTFAPGETVRSFEISIVADLRLEPDETIRVLLSDPINASLADELAIVTILNDDIAMVSIDDATIVEGDSGQQLAAVTVSLSNPSDGVITIDFETEDGSATAGQDYLATDGTLTFAIGEMVQTIFIPILGDTIDEFDEDFEVILTGQTGGAYLPYYPEADVDIEDNDTAGISISDKSITEGNSGSVSASFVVKLSTLADHPITIDYATANGSALAGADYLSASGALTIPAGQLQGIIPVTVLGETLGEPNETYFVNLTNASSGAVFVDAQAKGTIVNDDPGAFRVNDVSITEGSSGTKVVTLTVSLTRSFSVTTTIDYATANGSADSGNDFVFTSGTLNFAPGVVSSTVTVTINSDVADELDETFLLNLSNPTGGATIYDGQGVVTIKDDDLTRMSISDATLTEGDSGNLLAVFTVSLTLTTDHEVGVNFATLTTGTALSGVDYAASAGTITFAAGVMSKTIEVPIMGDMIDEVDETFYVKLSGATSASILDSQGTGKILDNDTSVVSISDYQHVEGNSGTTPFTFTVTLSNPNSRTVLVKYATANGTATTSNSDYQATSGTLTFLAGETSKTITVNVIAILPWNSMRSSW